MMNHFKKSKKKEFEMIDLRKMMFFLQIEVKQCSDGIYICQKKYALEILRQFGFEECNSVCNPNPIVSGCRLCKYEGGVKENET